jgi:hypothetical protein
LPSYDDWMTDREQNPWSLPKLRASHCFMISKETLKGFRNYKYN